MRKFSARETTWLQELDGIELAAFWPRAFAFLIDWTLVAIIFSLLAMLAAGGYIGYQHLRGQASPDVRKFLEEHQESKTLSEKDLANGVKVKVQTLDLEQILHVFDEIIVPVLYFGILLWKGKGQTPGKRLMKIRVVSIVHPHITFWHAVERALGYGAAALELGFGFVQFFVHPYRRCAQDRLAETIVVTERSYQAMAHKFTHGARPDVPVEEASAGLH